MSSAKCRPFYLSLKCQACSYVQESRLRLSEVSQRSQSYETAEQETSILA